jgi:hypothetical protein
MDRNLDHFELPRWQEPLTRRKHGGGRPPKREDRQAHGRTLLDQAVGLAERLVGRLAAAPPGINPRLVFKLRLHPTGNLDETNLSQLGLRVLAQEGSHAIVVFPDEPAVTDLRRRLAEYSGLVEGGHKYDYLSSIEAIEELTSADRTGVRLRAEPLGKAEIAALDIELWHLGDRRECQGKIAELLNYLERNGLRLTDSWVGQSLCLVRAFLNSDSLHTLLNVDYVKEIDRRPAPQFEMADVVRLDLSALIPPDQGDVPDDLVGVVVIDSGVAQRHPLLGPVMGDAQAFPSRLRTGDGPDDGDEVTGGHGTAVAGIAVYGDVGHCIAARKFRPGARLFSARVTDNRNQYDPDELLEHQLQSAVDYFLEHYPSARVFNISLGDSRLVYSDNAYQLRLAAAVDDLAYRYRERDIVFVVSAGNCWPDLPTKEDVVSQYPRYLLQGSARLTDPATSALALTVGGVSYGSASDLHGYMSSGTERLVAGTRGWPSPFTRSGFGVDGSIKPDLVDYAGDLRFERGNVLEMPAYAGLPTTARNFAPPDGRLFRTVAGTSFAAPRVANIAARLFRGFPAASSNLIRALLADSARLPVDRPAFFSRKSESDGDVLRVYGYGQPDFDRARWSASNAVLLISDGKMGLDTFRLFMVPSLPRAFLGTPGNGYISVALAFDPPTRHTRGDSYLGVGMEFKLYRNIRPNDLADAIRAWSKEDAGKLGDSRLPGLTELRDMLVDLKPGVILRKKGTLQRGIVAVNSARWQYDGEPLWLAVVCQRNWAPTDVTEQRFAVVLSIRHESVLVDLHAHIRPQARVYERVRVRV